MKLTCALKKTTRSLIKYLKTQNKNPLCLYHELAVKVPAMLPNVEVLCLQLQPLLPWLG